MFIHPHLEANCLSSQFFLTLTNTDHTNVQNATLGSLDKLKGGFIRGLAQRKAMPLTTASGRYGRVVPISDQGDPAATTSTAAATLPTDDGGGGQGSDAEPLSSATTPADGASNVTNTSAGLSMSQRKLHPERTDSIDEDNPDKSSRRGVELENFGSHVGRSDLNFFNSGEDPNSEQMAAAAHEDRRPNPRHQDLLRTMDLHRTLIEALNIDYNLAFMGARCTSKEKVKSREVSTTFSMSRSPTTPRPHEPINPSPRQPRHILAFHYPLVSPPPPNNPL